MVLQIQVMDDYDLVMKQPGFFNNRGECPGDRQDLTNPCGFPQDGHAGFLCQVYLWSGLWRVQGLATLKLRVCFGFKPRKKIEAGKVPLKS